MTKKGATAYDVVSYPTGLFRDTHPDHLATIATLHGLACADPRTARVLEVGGGDGMNMTAFAAAYPDARVTSFDLAASAVRRGRAVVEALGLANVDLRVGDIVEEAERLDGPFDYVIAHGLYAWVPDPVRAALMRLIGRVLAPEGVAFLSFNAKPGGHLRQALREMAQHEAAGITDPAERLKAGWDALAEFARGEGGRHPVLEGMRHEAAEICRKRPEVLHHDELGHVYAPRSLTEMAGEGHANGLSFLNDSQPGLLDSGFVEEGAAEDEATVLRAAQSRDYRVMRFFRQSLLVRAGRAIRRRPALDGLHRLRLSARATRLARHQFEIKEGRFSVDDDVLADLIERASAVRPDRVCVADYVAPDDDERLGALIQLFESGAIMLHYGPLPAVTRSERPCASALARFLVDARKDIVMTLDHQMMPFNDPAARAFLKLLDGTRDLATLEREWSASEHGATIPFADAMGAVTGEALLSS